MDSEALDRLVAEAGSHEEGILASVRTADGAHAIRFEDADVIAEWDGARNRLVLSSEIGSPPPGRAAHVYETLLSYNLLWRETGGLRMALTGPKGIVLQLVDLAGPEIEARTVAIVAANLAQRTVIWRAFLESEGSDVAAPAPPNTSEMIRA